MKLTHSILGLKRQKHQSGAQTSNAPAGCPEKLLSPTFFWDALTAGSTHAFLGAMFNICCWTNPTNGLDPMGIREIRLLLKERLKSPPNTVFLVSSHNLTEIAAVTDVLIFIRGGKIIKVVENDYNEKGTGSTV